MKTIEQPDEVRMAVRDMHREGERVGLVPTMGALHEGHLSLVREAGRLTDRVVVSIFVNPTQFGPHEDFDAYPRDMERDKNACLNAGVDIVFTPSAYLMYGEDASVAIEEDVLSQRLCGAVRPGHFRGVLTVVAKLFNIVQPDLAVFGQKDAQQFRMIQKMVHDLNFPVELVMAPIVREPDGLAMSSRNAYLSPSERTRALSLSRAVWEAERRYAVGERDASTIGSACRAMLEEGGVDRIDYVEVVDFGTLRPVPSIEGRCLVAVAAYVGRTRLIDNTILAG